MTLGDYPLSVSYTRQDFIALAVILAVILYMRQPLFLIHSVLRDLLFFFFFLYSNLPAFTSKHSRAPPQGRHLCTMRSHRRRSIGPTHAQGKRQKKRKHKQHSKTHPGTNDTHKTPVTTPDTTPTTARKRNAPQGEANPQTTLNDHVPQRGRPGTPPTMTTFTPPPAHHLPTANNHLTPRTVHSPNRNLLAAANTSAKRIYGLESVNRLTWITQIIWISQPLHLPKLEGRKTLPPRGAPWELPLECCGC